MRKRKTLLLCAVRDIMSKCRFCLDLKDTIDSWNNPGRFEADENAKFIAQTSVTCRHSSTWKLVCLIQQQCITAGTSVGLPRRNRVPLHTTITAQKILKICAISACKCIQAISTTLPINRPCFISGNIRATTIAANRRSRSCLVQQLSKWTTVTMQLFSRGFTIY